MFLLVVAMLSVTVGGLSLDPRDYDLVEGASASAARLRQGTSLAEYMLSDKTCSATCNNETYTAADTECQGTFSIRCSGGIDKEGYNITYTSVIECLGHWSQSGWNESDSTSREGQVDCNGAFHERTIIMFVEDHKAYLIVSRYGCMFMFTYETTSMGGTTFESSTCHGAGGYGLVQYGPEVAEGVSEEFLEELLDDVSDSFGPMDLELHPDAMTHSGLSSPIVKPVFSVRCNGEEASIAQPCHGSLEITIQTKNTSIAEECRGWWIPVPGPSMVFGCTGAWTVGISRNSGQGESEQDVSCVGHNMLAGFHANSHGRNFTGSRSLCIGREDTSDQTQNVKTFMDLEPMIQETDIPVYIS